MPTPRSGRSCRIPATWPVAFAPCNGRVGVFNEKLLNDPSVINTDNYEEGWLYEFSTNAELLSPQQYVDLLAAGWEKTQQVIKGQMNE